jgi:hypothetical protein
MQRNRSLAARITPTLTQVNHKALSTCNLALDQLIYNLDSLYLDMANLEILGNTNADQRASQALSLQLSAQSMTGIGPLGNRTLWAMAKMLGNSATREGSLVVENGFPNPFGIKEVQSSPKATVEQTPGADPEKNVAISQEKIPPCDGGHRAWAYLLGAAAIEGIMWGKLDPPQDALNYITSV